jgi:hypothetical protein
LHTKELEEMITTGEKSMAKAFESVINHKQRNYDYRILWHLVLSQSVW